MTALTQDAAQFIADHRLNRRPLPALPAAIRPASVDAAYEVQDQLHGLLTARALGAIAGYKIGCTTAVMQAFLGISHPCGGGVFADTVHRGHGRFAHADFLHVGVECEIVVLLDRDLPAAAAPFDFDKVAAAVGACAPGMEVVDDRYVDYKSLDTPTLIADDFFDAAVVIGAARRDWQRLDLSKLAGRTLINDEEVGLGRSGDVMGHPFNALAWLANALAARGIGLRAGQFVFTGSVVETRWVNCGDQVRMRIDELGEVGARFE